MNRSPIGFVVNDNFIIHNYGEIACQRLFNSPLRILDIRIDDDGNKHMRIRMANGEIIDDITEYGVSILGRIEKLARLYDDDR